MLHRLFSSECDEKLIVCGELQRMGEEEVVICEATI
jgi:hypothetical protein